MEEVGDVMAGEGQPTAATADDNTQAAPSGQQATFQPVLVARLHQSKDQSKSLYDLKQGVTRSFQEKGAWSVHGGDKFMMHRQEMERKQARTSMSKSVSFQETLCEVVELPTLLRAPSIMKRSPRASATPVPPPRGTVGATYLIRSNGGDASVGFEVDAENVVVSECDPKRGTLVRGDRIVAANGIQLPSGDGGLLGVLPAGRSFVLFDVARPALSTAGERSLGAAEGRLSSPMKRNALSLGAHLDSLDGGSWSRSTPSAGRGKGGAQLPGSSTEVAEFSLFVPASNVAGLGVDGASNVVTSVDPTHSPHCACLAPGDVLVAINGRVLRVGGGILTRGSLVSVLSELQAEACNSHVTVI